MAIKDQIEGIASQLRNEDESYDVKFYESEDLLEFLLASAIPDDIGSGDGEETPDAKKPKGTPPPGGEEEPGGEDEENPEPIIDGKGKKKKKKGGDDEEDGDEEESEDDKSKKRKKKKKKKKEDDEESDDEESDDEEDDEEDDSKSKKKKKKEKKLKVGDKVSIKTTGKVGVITAINPDGTYEVDDLASQLGNQSLYKEYDEGGYIIDDNPLEGAKGTYERGELEAVNEFDDEEDDEPDDEEDQEDDEQEQEDDEESDDEEDDDDSGDDDSGKPKPPKLITIDIDKLLARLNRIKKISYKLPAFVDAFFGYSIVDVGGVQYMSTICELVLFNLYAKDVFKRPSKITEENQNEILKSMGLSLSPMDFRIHANFLHTATFKDGNNGYRLKQPNNFLIAMFQNDLGYFEDLLNGWKQNGVTEIMNNDPNYAKMLKVFKYCEETEVIDSQYYRILSLAAILSPELFNEKTYLKEHLMYITSKLRLDYMAFTNMGLSYNGIILSDEYIYERMRSKNLNLYNVVKNKMNDDYTIYVCLNIRTGSGSNEKLSIFKMSIPDLFKIDANTPPFAITPSLNSRIITSMIHEMRDFYLLSRKIRDSENEREIILGNLNKLHKLQVESYKNYIADLKLITTEYGI
jgi:hypothetical protein